MATVQNCVSFETGGLEEADSSTQGAPEIGTGSPTPKHGTYRLGLLGATTIDEFVFFAEPNNTALADWVILGFWVQFNDINPPGKVEFCRLQTSSTQRTASLRLTVGGNVEIRSRLGGITATAITPFTVNVWHRVEFVVQGLNPGKATLFVDGVNVASETGADYDTRVRSIAFLGGTTSGENMYVDSVYVLDQATEPTILGDFEVRAYGPAGGTGFTTKGTAPAAGSWANTDEIPFVDANEAEWTGTADSFSAVADGDDKNGPSGDTGIGTIHGAKYIGRWDRDGGGASTHFMRFGNDVDTPLGETADLALTTTITTFIAFTTAAGEVPLATENFEFGGRISGPQDMHLSDQMSFLLFSPISVIPNSGEIPLFISGSIVGGTPISGDITLFVSGKPSGQMDLFVGGKDNISGIVDLLIDGMPSGEILLFMGGVPSGEILLFIQGKDNISDNIDLSINGFKQINNNTTLFTIGCAPKKPKKPKKDLFTIPSTVIDIFEREVDALIRDLGKKIKLIYKPTIIPCVNCIFDPIGQKSANRFKPGGPIPFSDGARCPYCRGTGKTEEENSEIILGLVDWKPRDYQDFGISIQNANAIVGIKTLAMDAIKIQRATEAIVDYAISDIIKLRCRKLRDPSVTGLKNSRYAISFWQRI